MKAKLVVHVSGSGANNTRLRICVVEYGDHIVYESDQTGWVGEFSGAALLQLVFWLSSYKHNVDFDPDIFDKQSLLDVEIKHFAEQSPFKTVLAALNNIAGLHNARVNRVTIDNWIFADALQEGDCFVRVSDEDTPRPVFEMIGRRDVGSAGSPFSNAEVLKVIAKNMQTQYLATIDLPERVIKISLDQQEDIA